MKNESLVGAVPKKDDIPAIFLKFVKDARSFGMESQSKRNGVSKVQLLA